MNYLIITYDRASNSLVATVNQEREIKVAYNTTENTLSVIRGSEILKTTPVRENYPARAFIEYCHEIQKMFTDVPDRN